MGDVHPVYVVVHLRREQPLCHAQDVQVLADVVVFFFGGVQDNENIDDEDSDSDDEGGDFFNDLYSVNVENERATWTKIELSGKKDLTRKNSFR